MKIMLRLTGGKTKRSSGDKKNQTKNVLAKKSSSRKNGVQMKSVWLALPFDFVGLSLHLMLRLDGIPATKEAFLALMGALYDLLVSQL